MTSLNSINNRLNYRSVKTGLPSIKMTYFAVLKQCNLRDLVLQGLFSVFCKMTQTVLYSKILENLDM